MEIHEVPKGFPRDTMYAVVSGTQPKRCAVLVGRVYAAGQTDKARYERWLICEDLASQLVPVVRKDRASHPCTQRSGRSSAYAGPLCAKIGYSLSSLRGSRSAYEC